MEYCLEHVKPELLSIKRQSLVQCLHKLLLAKCSQLRVTEFINEEIDDTITFIIMFKVILIYYCYYFFASLHLYMYYGNMLVILV